MFGIKTRYYLFDAFGVPLYVDLTFAVLLLMFVFSLNDFGYGLTAALLLALSVVAHELGHALTARSFGYRTSDITISLLGGCASLIALPRRASQEFWTALAGPLVSFALSALGFLACAYYRFENHWAYFCFYFLAQMNWMLGLFNMMPGFPLDGGRIFRSVLRYFMSRSTATFVAMWVGRAFAIILGLSGLHAIFTGGAWGFVRLMIASMIWRQGTLEYMQAQMESAWDRFDDGWRARVSPPPYGGDGQDSDVTRG